MTQLNANYTAHVSSSSLSNKNVSIISDIKTCNDLFAHESYTNKCHFLKENPGCISGNTAADYFCCSLEKLSGLLNLPPTVAGVTLLPLGNGAPDVFSSIAAFMGKGNSGEVGLNSVLGGAVFVTCVVVGVVSLSVSDRGVKIDNKCFIRDICFFLFTILSLAVILIGGKVVVVAAVAFILIYVVYAFSVTANEVSKKHAQKLELSTTPLLLCEEGDDEQMLVEKVPHVQSKVSQWIWTPNVAIYANHSVKYGSEGTKFVWGWIDEELTEQECSYSSFFKHFSFLEVPLTLPRRLTIPIVEEERWSKGYAVASASLSPILLAFLWNTRDNTTSFRDMIVYFASAIIGCVLGILAYVYTRPDKPPQKFLFPWVFGGFLMSIVWFYIIANELVALLLSFGIIFGINPSILGVTILAWGNSMGDLVSNVAMAMNSQDGVQIAMSGCYAGPMFNTLVGLGISLLFGSWSNRPKPFIVPKDGTLFYTMGFLVLALIWSLIMLPRNNMCLNKTMGIGLILLYLVFLFFRITTSIDVVSLGDG
ncbi:hypothetical protein TanjilG_16688 [Lupinus angustifolius]|uniref:Sodium/calcium exchanger membrane region domain-containing protein n=1 Tax=Lupinus angustifolius TaxID=3871 RepID=A0A4P1QZF9_LUPAN|nr:hypothetical protein TanjilG_16688 [Lupinus angustifolius]